MVSGSLEYFPGSTTMLPQEPCNEALSRRVSEPRPLLAFSLRPEVLLTLSHLSLPPQEKTILSHPAPTRLENCGGLHQDSTSETSTWLISSADAIVYRVLGGLRRRHQGISLEEVLDEIGLQRPLAYQYTEKFRDKWTHRGFIVDSPVWV